jgi:hypothetical protein
MIFHKNHLLFLAAILVLASCTKGKKPVACIEFPNKDFPGITNMPYYLTADCSENIGELVWKSGTKTYDGSSLDIYGNMFNLGKSDTFYLTVKGMDGKEEATATYIIPKEEKKLKIFAPLLNLTFFDGNNSNLCSFYDSLSIVKGEPGEAYEFYIQILSPPYRKVGINLTSANRTDDYSYTYYNFSFQIPSQIISGKEYSGSGNLQCSETSLKNDFINKRLTINYSSSSSYCYNYDGEEL